MPHDSLLPLAATGLLVALAMALPTWLLSLWQRDASLADRLWPLLIVVPGWSYALLMQPAAPLRQLLMLMLASAWALRLALFITWRNRGHGEDRRYRAMREAHGARFGLRSLWSVFGLQALLAWVVSAPFLAAGQSSAPAGWLDALGLALALFGLLYEAVADAQLARFKAQAGNRGRVMDQGLWRNSRHPNYFGECCVWWGLGLAALGAGAGAAWGLVSPLLMTVLLLRVSGVRLLERDIEERRPAYRDYAARTPAFVPGPRRQPGAAKPDSRSAH
ncbi:DUF1295 domain-containing protein [Xenophilus arseniciresistens]|uniref:DUF1295 domain-containing protein n=1 Tax=Xenophilus arseniciresistens TaxID=1283306 RepID=A0AAE3N3I4_9BURK|nr:DUF1295 domain-containing protein [Xenophilus arseniciresistens]MDA7414880.1 DUF1295 domain-containing protein [Xenophilus arseniciresistens]